MSDLPSDPQTTKDDATLIADAKALGAASLGDVQTFAHSFIVHVSNDVTAALPAVASDVLDHFYSFIPAAARGFVQSIVGGYASGIATPLESSVKTQILTAAGAALNRIDAAIGAADVAIGEKPTTTTAAKTA